MKKGSCYTGCIFAYMFGEWAVLMEEFNGMWMLPTTSATANGANGMEYLQEYLADNFGMCVPAGEFERSRAVSGWMTAFIDPTGKENGPEVIFDELCKEKLRWIPLSKVEELTSANTAELVKAELRAQGLWRTLVHMFRSKVKRPLI